MWTWTLNWSEIRDDLVVGSCPITPEDVDRIVADTGVTALLSLQSDDCRAAMRIDGSALAEHARGRGLAVAVAPMRDFDPPDQRRQLPGAVRTLNALLTEGHKTYVHCTAGVNRAPLVVLAYLTLAEGKTVDEADALLRRARPEVAPYLDVYYGCREDLLAPLRSDVALRAWNSWQADPTRGAERDWFAAEEEVLRESFGMWLH